MRNKTRSPHNGLQYRKWLLDLGKAKGSRGELLSPPPLRLAGTASCQPGWLQPGNFDL